MGVFVPVCILQAPVVEQLEHTLGTKLNKTETRTLTFGRLLSSLEKSFKIADNRTFTWCKNPNFVSFIRFRTAIALLLADKKLSVSRVRSLILSLPEFLGFDEFDKYGMCYHKKTSRFNLDKVGILSEKWERKQRKNRTFLYLS